MKNILICFNYNSDIIIEHTIFLIDYLHNNQYNIFIDKDCENYITCHKKVNFIGLTKGVENCDVVVTIGGDGTLIHTVEMASLYNKPVMGINMGRLGFLATVNKDDLLNMLDILNDVNYQSKHMLMEVSISNGDETLVCNALNDVVVSKGNISKIIDLDVFYEDNIFANYRCDGLIVSTPTGSTAYSLSAGGPIINPSIHCFTLTPICPHSIFNKPVIFNDDTILNIKINEHNKNNVYVTIDGKLSNLVDSNTTITIKKSDRILTLLHTNDYDYYKTLRQKFIDKGFYL